MAKFKVTATAPPVPMCRMARLLAVNLPLPIRQI